MVAGIFEACAAEVLKLSARPLLLFHRHLLTEAGKEVHGSQEKIAFKVFLNEIDEHLKHCLTGADQERDRMIFWLYFRQGMSTKEIASLPTIGLGAKGVGSVIERLKDAIRKQIVESRLDSKDGGESEPKANPLAKSY